MRNKKLIKRRNDITQGWQFCSPIALEKEGEKEKKTVLQQLRYYKYRRIYILQSYSNKNHLCKAR